MTLRKKECEAGGVDPEKVRRLAMRLSRAGRDAHKMGITIFGGSGSGSLRIHDKPHDVQGKALVLAELDGRFDGGDGGCCESEDGLMRGE